MSGNFEIRPRGGVEVDSATPSVPRRSAMDSRSGDSRSGDSRSGDSRPGDSRSGDDALFNEFNAALARLESAGRDKAAGGGLMSHIDALAAVVERQAQELRVTRAAAAKLEAENERMRQMLKALIAAIDAGETRLFGTMEKAERRLRDLIDTGSVLAAGTSALASAAEPPPPPPARSRPPRPNLEPAPKPAIRVIE